jgi:hypothetical protein
MASTSPATSLLVVLVFLVGLGFAGACGGGSPASPAYMPGGATEDAAAAADASIAIDASDPTDGAPFAGCGTSPASGTIPADVLAVMSARCQTCHQMPPLNNAPFPLLSYQDVHSLYGGTIPKYQEMHYLIQPDGSPHMPYGNAPQLTADQFTTLDDWLVACAPPGE